MTYLLLSLPPFAVAIVLSVLALAIGCAWVYGRREIRITLAALCILDKISLKALRAFRESAKNSKCYY